MIGRKDVVATVLVVALVVPYLVFLATGEVMVIRQGRDMTAIALILGGGAIALLLSDDHHDAVSWMTLGLATASVVAGALALALSHGTAAEILLAAFVGTVLVVWAIELAEHLTIPPPHRRGGTR